MRAGSVASSWSMAWRRLSQCRLLDSSWRCSSSLKSSRSCGSRYFVGGFGHPLLLLFQDRSHGGGFLLRSLGQGDARTFGELPPSLLQVRQQLRDIGAAAIRSFS